MWQCKLCQPKQQKKWSFVHSANEEGIRTAVYAEALEREVQLEDGCDKHHYKVYYLLNYTFNDAVKLKLLCVGTSVESAIWRVRFLN